MDQEINCQILMTMEKEKADETEKEKAEKAKQEAMEDQWRKYGQASPTAVPELHALGMCYFWAGLIETLLLW